MPAPTNRLQYKITFVEKHRSFDEKAIFDVSRTDHHSDSFGEGQSGQRLLEDVDRTFLRPHEASTALVK